MPNLGRKWITGDSLKIVDLASENMFSLASGTWCARVIGQCQAARPSETKKVNRRTLEKATVEGDSPVHKNFLTAWTLFLSTTGHVQSSRKVG